MKKINYFFAAAMICMSVAACVKEAGNDNPGVNSGNTTEETIPDNYIELTFQVPGMDVKTSVDGNTVSWTAGDKIRICWDGGSSVSNAVVLEEGNASFTAMVAPEATDFYAVYPSTIEATVVEGNFNVTVPSSQSGRFADADIIVAKTSKDNLVFAFHHAVSLVKFVISDENQKGISRAQFVDLANNSQLTGALSIAFDESNAISANTVVEKTTEEINAGLDVIDVTAVQPGDNYMAVIPSKELAGFGLRLGSASKWYTGLVGENAIAVGERLTLGTVDTKIHDGDFYIKPEASEKGDATSWENAGGPAMLQSLIGDCVSGDAKNLAIAWRINGKKIKVAEGNYINGYGTSGFTARFVGNAPVVFEIEGGYTSSGEKSISAKTIFGSESETDESRAFFFYGDKVNVTLTDLIISGHKRTDPAGGGAIYSMEGATLALNNCTFKGNSTENGRPGGAIYHNGAFLSMNNCTFIENSAATMGGAFYSTSDVYIENCIFSSNTSVNSGGAICISAGGTLTIDGGSFSDNTAKEDGGAIFLSASHLKADGVTFAANICRSENTVRNGSTAYNFAQGGGAIMANAETTDAHITSTDPLKIDLSNCKFDGNHANYSTGGAFYVTASHLLLTADKCKFLNNRSDGNYSGPVFASETPGDTSSSNIVNLFFNACEFRGNKSENFTSYKGPNIGYIHYAYTNLGFNNCLFHENICASSTEGLVTRGAIVFANTTIVDAQGKGSTSLLKCDNNTADYPKTIVNSITVNTSTNRNGCVVTDWASQYLTFKNNLYGSYDISASVPANGNTLTTALPEGCATKIDELGKGMSYYSWSGNVEGFVYTSKTNVANTIKANTKFGQDFYNWLTSLDYGNGLNALDVDIRGVERTSNVWPGSYQN